MIHKSTGTKHFDEVSKIKSDYTCNSKMTVTLTESRVCGEQYTDSRKTKYWS